MNKLAEGFKNLREKFNNLRKGARLAIIISSVAIFVAIITFIVYSASDKYSLLFSNVDSKDAQIITKALEDSKLSYKVKGDSIYVPKENVDELRLQLASELTGGSTGYELMDEGSSFGMTDEEFKLKKLRSLQGELERTIKSFPQIENARVHITPSKDSVFIKDSTPGSAAVYLQLKQGERLSEEQVKSIIALIAGSTDNVPKGNVEVIDSNMNLLSKGLFDEEGNELTGSTSVEAQQAIEKAFEQKLENSVVALLEKAFGKGKVSVSVNADLDFDAKQTNQIIYDPNTVIVGETWSQEINSEDGEITSDSPVDNNMGNTIIDVINGEIISSKEEKTVNYEVGKTETIVNSAPGEIERLTASVMVDGNLTAVQQENVRMLAANALGLSTDRGDEITVVGMPFDTTEKDMIAKELADMVAEAEKERKFALYKSIALLSLGAIALIVLAVIIIKLTRKGKEEELLAAEGGLNVVIGDEINPKAAEVFTPISFEEENQKTHFEKEIKGYAKEKPEQVAEIIKAWLTEDER